VDPVVLVLFRFGPTRWHLLQALFPAPGFGSVALLLCLVVLFEPIGFIPTNSGSGAPPLAILIVLVRGVRCIVLVVELGLRLGSIVVGRVQALVGDSAGHRRLVVREGTLLRRTKPVQKVAGVTMEVWLVCL
jgi:hypothetical protein